MAVRERVSVIAGEWKAMSEAEKEVWTHWTSLELHKLIVTIALPQNVN